KKGFYGQLKAKRSTWTQTMGIMQLLATLKSTPAWATASKEEQHEHIQNRHHRLRVHKFYLHGKYPGLQPFIACGLRRSGYGTRPLTSRTIWNSESLHRPGIAG